MAIALISAALMVPWMNAGKKTLQTQTPMATITQTDVPFTTQCYRLLVLIIRAHMV